MTDQQVDLLLEKLDRIADSMDKMFAWMFKAKKEEDEKILNSQRNESH